LTLRSWNLEIRSPGISQQPSKSVDQALQPKRLKTIYQPLPGHGSFWRMQRFFAGEALRHIRRTLGDLIKPDRVSIEDLLPLRDQHRGESCLVFGNGPSLSILDPAKVKAISEGGMDVFCVNHFVESDKFDLPHGVSLVLSDPKTLEGDWVSRYAESKVPVRRVFIPHRIYKPGLVQAAKGGFEVFPFNDNAVSWIFSRNIDPTRPRSYLSMTLYKALAIAVFLGYSKIFLCGLDNSYVKTFFVDSENRLYRMDEHFDSEIYQLDGQRDYHLSDRYGPGGVAAMLMDYALQFSQLHRFPQDRIVNLDPDSLIDVFSKSHDLDIYKISDGPC
jgi:hypothetical protein